MNDENQEDKKTEVIAPIVPVVIERAAVKEAEPVQPAKRRFPNRLIHEAVKARIVELVKSGKSRAEIKRLTGIHHWSINNARRKDPQFNLSLTEASAYADHVVENALWRRAKGMDVRETKRTTSAKGEIETTETIRRLPPDTQAAQFWLARRKPAEWANTENHSVNQSLTIVTVSGKRIELKR